jgi:hypothetical protein
LGAYQTSAPGIPDVAEPALDHQNRRSITNI